MAKEDWDRLKALIECGNLMSNVCFNISQQSQINTATASQMKDLQRQWDRLYTECRPTFAKLKALPAEFDAVAMGC